MNNSSITPFYKVKWKVDGVYKDQKFDSLAFAWGFFEGIQYTQSIEFVGLYHVDQFEEEHEMVVRNLNSDCNEHNVSIWNLNEQSSEYKEK